MASRPRLVRTPYANYSSRRARLAWLAAGAPPALVAPHPSHRAARSRGAQAAEGLGSSPSPAMATSSPRAEPTPATPERGARFRDFSTRSELERLVASAESALRGWAAAEAEGGVAATAEAEGHEVKRAALAHADGRRFELRVHPAHPAEQCDGGYEEAFGRTARDVAVRWFGLEGAAFLTLAPDSFSGRSQDAATTAFLLSVGALALSAAGQAMPLLVPVGQVGREGFEGVANEGENGQLVRFSSALMATNAPPALGHLDGLVAAFAAKVAEAVPCADAAVDAAEGVRASLCHTFVSAAVAQRAHTQADRRAASLARLSALAGAGSDDERDSGPHDASACGPSGGVWDADQPWSEWAALSEPMACLELRVVWRRMGARHVSDNPVYSDLRPLEADTWTLRQLETHPADGVSGDTSGFGSADGFGAEQQVSPRRVSFTSLLHAAAQSMLVASSARVTCIEQLAAGEAPIFGDRAAAEALSLMPVPPPGVLERVVEGIFRSAHAWRSQSEGVALSALQKRQRSLACSMKGAPAGSLTALLALHSVEFSNARAVAVLWQRMVRDLRWLWDARMLIPGLPDDGSPPDMAYGLLHQKLWLLNTCIVRAGRARAYEPLMRQQSRRAASEGRASEGGEAAADAAEGWDVDDDDDLRRTATAHWTAGDDDKTGYMLATTYMSSAEHNGSGSSGEGGASRWQRVMQREDDGEAASGDDADELDVAGATDDADGWDDDDLDLSLGAREEGGDGYDTADDDGVEARDGAAADARGVDGLVIGLNLLKTGAQMMRPALQPPPVLTEDELRRRQEALAALGEGAESKEARSRLQSEELVSAMSAFKAANPGCCFADFIRFDSPADWVLDADGSDDNGTLSERMARPGNLWMELWAETAPCPASEQRPLFRPEAEAERVLHWLETATPLTALSELLAAGASAAAQTLAASPAASLPAAERALERLITEASSAALDAPSAQQHALGDASIASATTRAEHMLAAFDPAERKVLEAAWLAQRLPPEDKTMAPLLESLLDAGRVTVTGTSLRQALAPLFVPDEAARAGTLSWCDACYEREFVLRADAASGGAPLAQRMYASYAGESCRIALALRSPL